MITRGTSAGPRAGYTLIEVMVVVGILTALAALGFTGFQQAQQSARSTRTLAQLRDIGVGAMQWSTENSLKLLPCWDNTDGRNRSYAQVLDPYLHGVDEYREPDSKFVGANKRRNVRVTPYSHPMTFSLNRSVSRDVTRYGDYQERVISTNDLYDPSAVILAIDGCQNPSNFNQSNASTYELFFAIGDSGPRAAANDPIPVGPDTDTAEGDGWIRYVGGSANALMCDGSVRIFPRGTIRCGNIWYRFDD